MPKRRTIHPGHTKRDQRIAAAYAQMTLKQGSATKKRPAYPTGRNGTLDNVERHLNKMHGDK